MIIHRGGVRALSYAILPESPKARVRLINLTEGIGPIGLTPKNNWDTWVIPPVEEGDQWVVEKELDTTIEYVLRTISGESLSSFFASRRQSDNTVVIDGKAVDGELQMYTLIGRRPEGVFPMEPSTVELLSSSVLHTNIISRLRLVPNPTSGSVTLHTDSSPGSSRTVTLVDQLGRVVLSKEWDGENRSLHLNLDGLITGVYSVVVERSKGDMWLNRLIVW